MKEKMPLPILDGYNRLEGNICNEAKGGENTPGSLGAHSVAISADGNISVQLTAFLEHLTL